MTNTQELIAGLRRENDWLHHELNHRVRNILQVALSLLNTQLFFSEDEGIANAIKDNQRRILALALAYAQVAEGDFSGLIPMSNYIPALLGHVRESFDADQQLKMETDIDHFSLSANEAIAVGIIVNEAVYNTIQSGLQNSTSINIDVSLKLLRQNDIRLVISDNIGWSWSLFSTKRSGSLGSELIKGLACNLDATIFMTYEDGARLIIEFKKLINE
jgi:two-component sensor histidine kinase